MSEHVATVNWHRGEQPFIDNRYSRGHAWRFDGGLEVSASSSPQVVPLPLSVAENVDPEEAFVAALASCHMLFFLDLAARRGYRVDDYTDAAVAVMGRDADRRTLISRVTLRPRVTWSGERRPTAADSARLHHDAHRLCFIANSVRSELLTQAEDIGLADDEVSR